MNGKCKKTKEYAGSIRAPRMNFTNDLNDRSSPMFKQLERDLSDAVC